MSDAKHTPGPWKVLEHSWCETSIVAEGFDHGICGLDINHATEESQAADEALMAANARLIAVAPDLLALLVKLQASGIWFKSAVELNFSVDGEELEAELIALIAKAQGGAA